MNDFSLEIAASIPSALENISGRPMAKFIGGGTNILDLMKENVERPSHLVDITQLELKKISSDGDGVYIGALVTNADLAWDSTIEANYPLLSEAILAGASPQLRNMATTGGNLLQRTRCYYFYDTGTPCNKREPGTGCAALTGLNRIHAILGHSQSCIAVHPSDMCVALRALDAEVHVEGVQGKRIIKFKDFHRLPEERPEMDNTLLPHELITHVSLPPKTFNHHFSYLKIRDRASYAFALVSVAVALDLKDEKIQEARISLGGVAHKPWRDEDLEKTLKGKPATTETFKVFAEELLSGAQGFEHNSFKIKLAKRGIVKAMRDAAKRTMV